MNNIAWLINILFLLYKVLMDENQENSQWA